MTEDGRRESEDTQWTVNTNRKFNFVVKCNFFCRNALQVAVDFTFFFVAVVILHEWLVVRHNFSSFMSPFQSRVTCRNLPYQGLFSCFNDGKFQKIQVFLRKYKMGYGIISLLWQRTQAFVRLTTSFETFIFPLHPSNVRFFIGLVLLQPLKVEQYCFLKIQLRHLKSLHLAWTQRLLKNYDKEDDTWSVITQLHSNKYGGLNFLTF